MEQLAYILLPLLLAVTGFLVVRDKAQYEVFKALSSSQRRQTVLRRWVLESFLVYGVGAVVCLIVIGHASALHALPDAFLGLSSSIRSVVEDPGDSRFLRAMVRTISILIVPVLLFGQTAATLMRTYEEFKSKTRNVPGSELRDIQALFPWNAAERRWTAALSINAGLSEELFFRALAPLLLWIVTGSPWVAVVGATAWFGFAHVYQGLGGILATGALGAVLMAIYLYTGSIWLVVVIHIALDLNDLALAPWFAEYLERGDSR